VSEEVALEVQSVRNFVAAAQVCVAAYCSVLQCIAVCCSVLQCVVECCRGGHTRGAKCAQLHGGCPGILLQRIAVCCSVLQCVVVCYSVLQCVAVCCSVLQCVAVCCSVLRCVAEKVTLEVRSMRKFVAAD